MVAQADGVVACLSVGNLLGVHREPEDSAEAQILRNLNPRWVGAEEEQRLPRKLSQVGHGAADIDDHPIPSSRAPSMRPTRTLDQNGSSVPVVPWLVP